MSGTPGCEAEENRRVSRMRPGGLARCGGKGVRCGRLVRWGEGMGG